MYLLNPFFNITKIIICTLFTFHNVSIKSEELTEVTLTYWPLHSTMYLLNQSAGAALSDIIYALMTGLGMSFVMDFIDNKDNVFWLKLLGSVMLFIFGIYMFKTDPRKSFRPVSNSKGTLVHNFTTAFLVTLSNPLIIFLFIALFNMLTFVIPGNWFGQCLGYLSIVTGAMLWWLGLTYVINKMRSNFGVRGIMRLNRTIGSVVLAASIIYALMTLLNLSLY